MARIRSIKPDIRKSRTVCSWPYVVRWTFAGLPGYLDDAGRGLDDVRLIKAELYPLDDDMTARKLEQHLLTIATNGPLCRYEVDGHAYLHIVSWEEHQRVNRPTPSRIPPCPKHESSVSPHGVNDESLTEPSSQERKGKEQGSDAAPPPDEPEREDVNQVCAAVAEHVLAVTQRKPTITAEWRKQARLLIDSDDRSVEDILRIVEWVGRNDFWAGNILSVPKLRKQFGQLWAKSQVTTLRVAAEPQDPRHTRLRGVRL
jgi:hypothetical protein